MFKNAIAYLVTEGFRLDSDMLLRCQARPCGPTEARTSGFATPCFHSTAGLAHHVGGYTVICLETEERVLPGSVVADLTEERAKELEKQQGYKPGRKQMQEIKERVFEELLPRAFTQKRRTNAIFAGQFFIVDTSSPARADMVISALRIALDDLPLDLIKTNKVITGEMIQWLLGERPYSLTVDDFCEMEKAEPGKPAIAYKRTNLDENDMRRRITDGYVPRKVGVTYAERLSFKVDDSLHLKQLVLLDIAKGEPPRNAAEAFDADMVLMTGELIGAINFLIQELGGLQAPEPDLLTGANSAQLDADDSEDELYLQAVQLVLKDGRPSISFVQRHLRIGYNRAARLIEDMERAGIVSPVDSSGSRKTLVTLDALKVAASAMKKLNDTLVADGITATLEHNGEVLATFGSNQQ